MRLNFMLIRSSPARPKCSLITEKREKKNAFSTVWLTGLPSVPFQVNVPNDVPTLKIVTGICASSLAFELAVSVML